MEGKIIMSSREFQRMRVFREAAERRMTLVAAGEGIPVSLQNVYCLHSGASIRCGRIHGTHHQGRETG
jgi:hypothetical protein